MLLWRGSHRLCCSLLLHRLTVVRWCAAGTTGAARCGGRHTRACACACGHAWWHGALVPVAGAAPRPLPACPWPPQPQAARRTVLIGKSSLLKHAKGVVLLLPSGTVTNVGPAACSSQDATRSRAAYAFDAQLLHPQAEALPARCASTTAGNRVRASRCMGSRDQCCAAQLRRCGSTKAFWWYHIVYSSNHNNDYCMRPPPLQFA